MSAFATACRSVIEWPSQASPSGPAASGTTHGRWRVSSRGASPNRVETAHQWLPRASRRDRVDPSAAATCGAASPRSSAADRTAGPRRVPPVRLCLQSGLCLIDASWLRARRNRGSLVEERPASTWFSRARRRESRFPRQVDCCLLEVAGQRFRIAEAHESQSQVWLHAFGSIRMTPRAARRARCGVRVDSGLGESSCSIVRRAPALRPRRAPRPLECRPWTAHDRGTRGSDRPTASSSRRAHRFFEKRIAVRKSDRRHRATERDERSRTAATGTTPSSTSAS